MANRYGNYQILANDFLLAEDYSRALNAFQKAYKFASTVEEEIDCLFEIADIYWLYDELEDAIEIYKKILEKNPEESGALYALGILTESEEDNYSTALGYYRRAIKSDPYYSKAYYYQAHIWDRLGDEEVAKELFLQCLEINPYDYLAANDLGSILEQEGNYELARDYFLKALEIYPDYGRALYNMGVIEHRLHRDKISLDYYKQAKERSPDKGVIYLNMSAIYIQENQLREAHSILTEGIEVANDIFNLYYNRACVYVKCGQEEEALKDLKQAIEMEPNAIIWARRDNDLMEIARRL